ncbi:MAG: hypothetical protein H7Y31_11115 [Chitinophagaceae bacterium]|nr:hypothetical protein [Chitinophagaceae bacterium]
MRKIWWMVLCCLPLVVLGQDVGDEFNGPLASWANVKTRFRAKGDGKTDDTKAIQSALDSLTVSAKSFNTGKAGYTALYLPPGKYIISSTLVLRGKIGVIITGEHPGTTSIIWKGKANDTMFWANGSAYFKVARIAWDTKGVDGMEAIGLHWKNRWNTKESQSFAALNIEIADCIFKGGFKLGISGGTAEEGTNHNDSEVAIRRCSFYSCKEAAIKIRGYNALDYWIWDSRFYNCKVGVTTESGNYHVYRSYFYRSTAFDVSNKNGYYTSMRGCYSYNSKAFSGDEGASCNPFKRVFQDNTIINTRNVSVQFYHMGKLTFLDNKFTRNIDSNSLTNVDYRSWCPGSYEVLSVNNQYGYAKPIAMDVPRKKMITYRDGVPNTALRPDTAAFLATMHKTPATIQRKLYAIPANADRKKIQWIIDNAAKQSSARTIVHFPRGTYVIDSTITVPANASIQLIGDGFIYSSSIIPASGFPKNQPLIHVKGPTAITIRDLQLGQNSSNKDEIDGIRFSNIDQKNAVAIVDQLYSSASNSINLEKVCNLKVQNENSFFSTGNRVMGCADCSSTCDARLTTFGGQFAGVTVQDNGRFIAKDCWWEGKKQMNTNYSGSGAITIDGAMIAPERANADPSFIVKKFEGRISLLNLYIQGALKIEEDNPRLSVFAWNINFYHKMEPLGFIKAPKYRGVFRGITAQCFDATNPECKNFATIADQEHNVADTDSYLLEMIEDDRNSKPITATAVQKGVSSIFMSRIAIGNLSKAVVFNK